MTIEPKFLRRFEQIRGLLRRHQVRLGMAATTLAAATGLGLLAWSDHRFALERSVRAVGLGVVALITLAILERWLVAPLRWWTRPRTAAEIEGRFPELGQRIRTIVQYAGRADEGIAREGVKPSLVEALGEETEGKAEALPLDRIVPRRRTQALASLAAAVVAVLAIAAATGPEWRVALQRALLIERPYTTVEVAPGNVLVDQGQDVAVGVVVRGRPRPAVTLLTRPSGQADARWTSAKIPSAQTRDARREVKVEKVKDPVEYRVVAGPAASPTFAIRVRYPLVLRKLAVEVTPPSYTGLDPKTTEGGDVQGVEGSTAAFRISFDAPPDLAHLELVEPSKKQTKPGEPAPGPTILPLERRGDAFVASLPLVKGLDYRVVASTADGRVLPNNRHRIDVREDRTPPGPLRGARRGPGGPHDRRSPAPDPGRRRLRRGQGRDRLPPQRRRGADARRRRVPDPGRQEAQDVDQAGRNHPARDPGGDPPGQRDLLRLRRG